MTLAMVVAVLLSATPVQQCEEELEGSLKALANADVADRPTIALGSVAYGCAALAPLSEPLLANLNAVAHGSPEDAARTLGLMSGPAEARADFEAACPGWSQKKIAKQFLGADNKVTADVFTACGFAKLDVVNAREFARAEVHFATSAFVVRQALVSKGINAALARRVARAIIVPLELGQAPSVEKRPADEAKVRKATEGLFK
ncbi:MAG: hypothetical protein ACOZQL_14385 [Myxococcota bacterium]